MNRVALKISPIFLRELFIEVRVLIEGDTMLRVLETAEIPKNF